MNIYRRKTSEFLALRRESALCAFRSLGTEPQLFLHSEPQRAAGTCPPDACPCGLDGPVPACTLHSTFVGPWLAALIFGKHRLVVHIVAVVAACIATATACVITDVVSRAPVAHVDGCPSTSRGMHPHTGESARTVLTWVHCASAQRPHANTLSTCVTALPF